MIYTTAHLIFIFYSQFCGIIVTSIRIGNIHNHEEVYCLMEITFRRASGLLAIAIVAGILFAGLFAGTAAAQDPMAGGDSGGMTGMSGDQKAPAISAGSSVTDTMAGMSGDQKTPALSAGSTVTGTMPCGGQKSDMMAMMMKMMEKMGSQNCPAVGASSTVTDTMMGGGQKSDMMAMMMKMMEKMGSQNCPAVAASNGVTDTMPSGQGAAAGCGGMMGGGMKGGMMGGGMKGGMMGSGQKSDMMAMMMKMMEMMGKMGSQNCPAVAASGSITDTMPAGHGSDTGKMDMGGDSGSGSHPTGQRLTVDQAQAKVSDYLTSNYDNAADLKVAEVMEFEHGFYALIQETSTGVGAFELLIDPYSGNVAPEYGPNMMWNTKYGRMAQLGQAGTEMTGGMMRGYDWSGQNQKEASADMPVKPEEAVKYAQEYLDKQNPGMTAETQPDKFYGYYTLHFLDKDGKVQGMVSVNGYTGRVWYHTWHGKPVDSSTDNMKM